MADTAVATEQTCGICLEDPKDPLDLPCGHSFCDGCLNEWRSRYGVAEETRRRCPICRARIPPSKEMVATLLSLRATKRRLENDNETSLELYRDTCRHVEIAEEKVGKDWDGETVLQDRNDKQAVVMPDYVPMAVRKGDINTVLRWINVNRAEDRVNAIASAEIFGLPSLMIASGYGHLTLATLLLQLGADVDHRSTHGGTAISYLINANLDGVTKGDVNKMAKLLLSWGASFFPGRECSREYGISQARKYGKHELADLLESELGGRRCEIVNLLVQPELNGKTCVADEYLPGSNQYNVTLETKSKEVLVLSPDNLKRRDRTPQDCGYYVEFKNGRTIRHDFDSSEDCQAFVASLNRDDESQPVATEESEARAEQAAAELLAELGLDDSPNESFSNGCKAKKSKKKKKVGKKKKK